MLVEAKEEAEGLTTLETFDGLPVILNKRNYNNNKNITMIGTLINLLQARHGGSMRDKGDRMDRGPAFIEFIVEQFQEPLHVIFATW